MFIFTGTIEQEILVKAAKGAIKVNAFEPFNEQYKKIGGLDTTLETLQSTRFDAGYVYIVQSICCIEIGTGTPQIKMGLYNEVTKWVYESFTVAAAENSVEYVGQLIVLEGLRVYADFESAVAGDTIYMNINGYRIKK